MVPQKKSSLLEAKLFLKYLPSDVMFFVSIKTLLR
jgi:hypothetical protein